MELSDIRTVVEYNQKNFRDTLAFVKEVRGGSILHEKNNTEVIFKTSEDGGKTYAKETTMKISNTARRQLFDKLHVKTPINSLLSSFGATDQIMNLVNQITNFGIQRQRRELKFVVDMKMQKIVGVVSKFYQRIPNKQILEEAIKAYGDKIDRRFSYIDDREMVLYIESNIERTTPTAQEKILYGFNVGNSETGWHSLSIGQSITFLRCLNGQTLGEMEEEEILYHTQKELEQKFQTNLNKFLVEDNLKDIIRKIDNWTTRPEIITDINNDVEINRLITLLKKFGITKKHHIDGIIDLLREKRQESVKLNAFWIGNAVNNYASNVLKDPYESMTLLTPAYNIMTSL